jgi:hypothetical protein
VVRVFRIVGQVDAVATGPANNQPVFFQPVQPVGQVSMGALGPVSV